MIRDLTGFSGKELDPYADPGDSLRNYPDDIDVAPVDGANVPDDARDLDGLPLLGGENALLQPEDVTESSGWGPQAIIDKQQTQAPAVPRTPGDTADNSGTPTGSAGGTRVAHGETVEVGARLRGDDAPRQLAPAAANQGTVLDTLGHGVARPGVSDEIRGLGADHLPALASTRRLVRDGETTQPASANPVSEGTHSTSGKTAASIEPVNGKGSLAVAVTGPASIEAPAVAKTGTTHSEGSDHQAHGEVATDGETTGVAAQDTATNPDVDGGGDGSDRPGEHTEEGGEDPSRVDYRELEALVTRNEVRVTRHPTLPISIYNYSHRTQRDGLWTPLSERCRGLIVEDDRGETPGRIVARPFTRMFELGPGDELPSHALEMSKKYDGSLGIQYWAGTEWRLATRGSFNSRQAEEGSLILAEYTEMPDTQFQSGVTYLWEIIYPGDRTRRVVDYGNMRDIVLIGMIETATGRELPLPAQADVPYPVAERISNTSTAADLRAQDIRNEEGYVALDTVTGERFKVKFPLYELIERIQRGEITGIGVDASTAVARFSYHHLHQPEILSYETVELAPGAFRSSLHMQVGGIPIGGNGVGANEESARETAAMDVIRQIDTLISSGQLGGRNYSDNPVSALEERSNQWNFPSPVYTDHRAGNTITCTIRVIGAEGKEVTFKGSASFDPASPELATRGRTFMYKISRAARADAAIQARQAIMGLPAPREDV